MEASSGIKKRIEDAKLNSEFIKIIFQYPAAQRATIKSGKVKKVYEDSFDFDEIYDGHATYSYNFIVEIHNKKESGIHGTKN